METDELKKRLKTVRILVVGDVMLDRYWFGSADRISPEAPVPVVRVNETEYRLGGAANVALNVVKQGVQVTLLSVRGEDQEGDELESLLHKNDINSEIIIDKKLSVRQAENFVKIFKKKPNALKLSKDANLKDLEQSISDKTGLKVYIKNNSKNKGTIAFSYHDLDQLNKIIDIIKSNY